MPFSRIVFSTARVAALFCAGALLAAAPGAQALQRAAGKPSKMLVYIGTYSQRGSKGIYTFQLDPATGRLTPVNTPAETRNPSFLALHPNGKYLYAVNEVEDFGGARAGAMSAFAIDPQTGALTFLNQRTSRGGAPCHLTIDRAGRHALVANYSGGSVAVLPIGADGRLGEPSDFEQHEGKSVNPQRQEAPHAHSINLDRENRRAFAADLGLDRIVIYRYDGRNGTLTPGEPAFAAVAPGSGPRHFAFHPSGRYAYVINEMLSTVTAFRYDSGRGQLESLQTLSTLPDGFQGNSSTAEVQVHPNGKLLYGSNRGHNSLAIYRIDERTGRLTLVGHQPTGGKTPRNFGIDPSGTFLIAANQDSDTLVVFRIDPESGRLTQVGDPVAVPMPVCVKFLPRD